MLETVNIKHANEACDVCRVLRQALVDDRYEPVKDASVNELGHRIADNHSLRSAQSGHDLIRSRNDLLLHSPLLVFAGVDTQQVGHIFDVGIIFSDEGVAAGLLDLDVSNMKQCS